MKKVQYLTTFAVLLAAVFYSAFGGPAKDIVISGNVVDSVSGDPISDAVVVLLSNAGTGVDTLDTLFTDVSGGFSATVTVADDAMMVICVVIKEGYVINIGYGMIQSDNVDLGTIKLITDTPIKYVNLTGFKKGLHAIPNNVVLYSLKGQILYSGTDLSLRSILPHGINRSQPLIAFYKFNNTFVYMKKITEVY